MSNTITIELCAEDRARLDRIAELLEPVRDVSPSLACQEEGEKFGNGLAEGLAQASAPTPEPEKPKATLTDIQSLVQKLAASGSDKRNAVKKIVNAYASRVSEIPEEKFGEVMEQLTALEGA